VKLALSTMWWGEGEGAVEDLVARTVALGFTGIELDYRRQPETLGRLREVMATAGLQACSMHAPFPCPPGEAPLRQADLAADDDFGHQHAEALAARTIAEAAAWGIRVVVLHGGDIRTLAPLEGRLKGLFEGGYVDGAELNRLRQELRKRRAEEAPRRLERVRRALGRLVPQAEKLGVRIALETRAEYRDLPSLGEVGVLLDEFGPAVGYWHDLGHAFRQEALGFSRQEEWLLRYADRMVGMHLHDSIGLTDHLPPGQGDVPWERLVPLLPASARRVLEVQSSHNAGEVEAGVAHLRALGVV
jgi:sugar phosphate isomerase/epimerase